MDQTYMKEKPVVPLLLSMGIPVIISMIAGALYNIVDSIFVAMISEDAMTAVPLVYPIQNFANAIAIGFGIGISAQIAICLGAGNRETASKAATHGLGLALVSMRWWRDALAKEKHGWRTRQHRREYF